MTTRNKPPLAPDAVDNAQAKPPATNRPASIPGPRSASDKDVAAFVERMKSLTPVTKSGRGRLVFAMDATMSRQPTWDMALALQSEMFTAVQDVGGLDVQLVYFRGLGECRSSSWVSKPEALSRLMTRVACEGGITQIGKVITHAARESSVRKVNALVFVGDACEEPIDELCGRAGELGLIGCPMFLFQEGKDATASRAFAEIARLTKGAHCSFDAGSAQQLRDLLTAVAVYAAGGRRALTALADRNKGARLLITQMKREG